MKQNRKIISVMLLCILSTVIMHGQATLATTGGTATGSGGSVTYTVGQVSFKTYSGTNGSVAQGVQQPYEISVVTAIRNTEDISLEMNVYPNPTSGAFKLTVRSSDHKNLRFRIYDVNGLLLQDKKIESEETEIYLNDFSASVYFLKVIRNNRELKVFKVIKK